MINYFKNRRIRRAKAAAFYDDHLKNHPDIVIPQSSGTGSHIYHQYTLRILNGKRDMVKEILAKEDIPSMVYYPVPLSLQKAFSNLAYKKGDFPVTEQLCNEVLSLPMHTELSTEQLNHIVKTLLSNI